MAAASDLSNLQQPLAEAFNKNKKEGLTVGFTFGSSGMLAAQIRQGAPYDIYLSANERFVEDLAAGGDIVSDSVRVYAIGRLGLWSKDGSFRRLQDLRGSRLRHLSIPNPVHAPYGVAAREGLQKVNLWMELQPRIVFGENVRQALQFAESGNADAVITAWSLVIGRGVLIPGQLHAPIRQAAGIVAASPRRAAARRFLDFLASPEAESILQRFGFELPTPSGGPGRTRPSGQ